VAAAIQAFLKASQLLMSILLAPDSQFDFRACWSLRFGGGWRLAFEVKRMRWSGLPVGLFVAVVLVVQGFAFDGQSTSTVLTILYTNNINAALFPCPS